MVPGSSGVSQGFLFSGHGNGKLELAINRGTLRRNRFTESLTLRLQAHPTVYGRLIGSRMGASSVGLKRAGSAGRPRGRNGCRRFAQLGLRLFLLLLVPGAKECPQAPHDDAGRETPERKGLRNSQVGSVSQALCASSAEVQGRVAHGARGAASVGRPGIEPPSAAVRVGERCHPSVGTRHVGKPHSTQHTGFLDVPPLRGLNGRLLRIECKIDNENGATTTLASDRIAASQPHSQAFAGSSPSRQSGMVFSPSFKRCSRLCTPPVRLSSKNNLKHQTQTQTQTSPESQRAAAAAAAPQQQQQ
eukprot:scaffold4624_cov138-Isochrysis_galbana.AAC.8